MKTPGNKQVVARVKPSATPSLEELKAARALCDARPRKKVRRTALERLAIIERAEAAFEEFASRAKSRTALGDV